MARIERLTVQGFRSFGKEPQHLDIDGALAIVWGPNSEGKTSLAEAFEFLFTGDIARRELLASALDEFADALCNAHLPTGVPTFVEARIVTNDGVVHTLRRTVDSDFTKRQRCESTLELDGAAVTDSSFSSLGIELSEPPLSAPVLMQHTLAYLFTAKPQQRSVYFKTLLEVTDLDDVRATVRNLASELQTSPNEYLALYEECLSQPDVAPILGSLATGVPTTTAIRESVASAVEVLLAAASIQPAEDFDARMAQLDQAVEHRRSETFPLSGFRRNSEALSWEPPAESVWRDLESYVETLVEVDVETKRLIGLFRPNG